jgi:hypothetical protein
MAECSICLNTIRRTRTTKQLDCGHVYHGACIEQWLTAGGYSCPTCRGRVPGGPEYKMTVIVENTRTGVTTRTQHPQESSERLLRNLGLFNESFSVAEITFPLSALADLHTVFRDLGLNIDTSIFNTE